MSVPGVVGESITVGQIGRISLLSCEIGFGRPSDPVTGVPFGGPIQRHLMIDKNLDKTSSFFGGSAGSGLLAPDGILVVFRRPIASSMLEVCQMTLFGAKVEDYSVGFVQGGSGLSEFVRISFSKLVVKTLHRSSTGALISTASVTFSNA